jgi:uncharacterized membrane-anchored protein YhcB (DUF1043 family)
MNCEEVSIKLIDFLDGKLSAEESNLIEKHIQMCEKCMDEVRDYQIILQNIAESKPELPESSLKMNFYHMLHSEVEKQKSNKRNIRRRLVPYSRIAAAITLLVAGTFLGMILNPLLKKDTQNDELKELKIEVQDMKELVMMNMLDQESPSERIKAVNYAEEISSPNDQVIEALVKTLNTDKNVNVRMAAAYSLSKFSNRKSVLDSLVKSLDKQTDPIIQVVLMDILVQKHERRAIKPIQNIISNGNTIKEVKEIAKKNVQVLL